MIYFNVYIYIYEKGSVDGKIGSGVYEVAEEEKGGNGKEGRVKGRRGGPGQGVVLGRTMPNKSSEKCGRAKLPPKRTKLRRHIFTSFSLCSLHIAGFCHQ